MISREPWTVIMQRDGLVRAVYILGNEQLARQFGDYIEEELGCAAVVLQALSPVRELLNWRAYGGEPDEEAPRMWDDAEFRARSRFGRPVTNIPLPGMEDR